VVLDEAGDEIKKYFQCFFRKSCRLWDNTEKYGTVKQATDDNIVLRMIFTCPIIKATDTHTHTHRENM